MPPVRLWYLGEQNKWWETEISTDKTSHISVKTQKDI